MRGVSHQIAFFVALPAAVVLMIQAPTARALTAVSIYGASLAALFATSAVYHRITWTSARAMQRMKRLDHSAIVLLIAGTCTPFCLALPAQAFTTLLLVWGFALIGIARAIFWTTAPKIAVALIYVCLGWVLAPWLPEMARVLGPGPLVLVLAGGVLYSVGAAIYGKKWPNPSPRVFGYHEIFHLLVIAASALHFVAVTRVAQLL